MKHRGATCSWRSTGRPGGSSSASSTRKPRRTPTAFCEIWTGPARSASAPFSRITSYVGRFWLLRSAGHGASGVPDALIRLPRRALPSRNNLFHSEHRVRALSALTVLNTRSQIPSRKPEHYLRGQRTASTAATERGLSAWAHPLEEGAIGFAVFDHGVYGARHLGRDRGVGLAAQMGIVSIFRDVAFELVPEAVGPLENSGLAGHPERAPQPGIAVFRDPALTAEHAGLDGGEVHAAELQELPVMSEAAQVASLRQDGHGVDRADAGDGRQQLIVGQIRQQRDGPSLDLIALPDKAAALCENEAEHADRVGIPVDWKSNRTNGRRVNI